MAMPIIDMYKWMNIRGTDAGKNHSIETSIKDAFGKVFEESVFTAVPNLVGVPALVTSGVQLIGNHFSESTLLSLAHSVEKEGK